MNQESNSLYEKLELINETKHKIKQAIIDIGGNGYIDDDTLFENYPDAIRQVHTDIENTCIIFNQILNGSNAETEVSKLPFADLLGYITAFQQSRADIIAFLNTNGVPANQTDTLDELIGKLNNVEDAQRERYLHQSY